MLFCAANEVGVYAERSRSTGARCYFKSKERGPCLSPPATYLRPPMQYWIFRFTSLLRWYAGASTRYDVHSPRIHDFVREVYNDDRHYHAFDLIHAVRQHWQRRGGSVKLQSLGAPSKTTFKKERTVSSLVATNAIDDDCGRLLFRLALWLKADHILEFGTNAGISTLYLHAADTRARIQTVEGNADVAILAQETFAKAGASPHLHPYVSLFTDWLDVHWTDKEKLDLLFLDGDHRHQPTIDYVKRLLPSRTEQSVFVIADIHWSEGMEKAWEELKELPEVTASVDLYHFGLLFFDPGMDGPHISLVPTLWKPWRMGFFS
jgi:predicted O-methyltransferase YrrM